MAKAKSRSSRPASGQGNRSVVGVVSKAKMTASGAGVGATVKSTRVTPYQERLYALCKCIPAGKVATYGTLSAVLNSAPRAVGQGMRRNPFAPIVPCHRVIASSLELGGFSGSWGNGCENVQRKRSMLAEEGVPFDDAGRLLELSCLMSVEELRLSAKAAGVAVVR